MSSWYVFAFWGLVGGAIIDGLEFWRIVRTNGGTWPPEYRTAAYLFAEFVRLGAGAVLAIAFGLSEQITAPMGALAIGVAAPLVVEKLSQNLPVIRR